MLTDEIMYKALVEKDSSFEGIFYAAIKTTGIFCRPTCTARKPKKENVEYFSNSKEAILKGYRSCKVCKPLNPYRETPPYIEQLLDEINNDPSVKIKDLDLIQRNIEPSTVRRWFIKNHGITFHAYQRMHRINSAFKKIQNGESVTATAYDVGFESLSGFGESFKTIFGVAPSKTKAQTIIDFTRLETPLGTMVACATNQGICLLEFSDRKMLETELKMLTKLYNATIIQGKNSYFEILKQELQEYFEGSRQEFTIPLDTKGTDFQNQVWDVLLGVHYGSTSSYMEQALKINNPKGVRAVANANGMNRISIIIPCHRIIGSDGSLTGYGGGLWRKSWLLDFEKKNLKDKIGVAY
ncbi:bifunctional transcriptional activator/DNA repair enzyme AdaA [Flavobacterium sp. '19STA2R22 D10 B1']|uniref:bifunctional transcriptional activator/DNA repair enzyme AdaA n=1 Tax=Flavobacterium aerium TaxID=3037261 RepID=UPI00278C0077|nr:methylated-DNA--[protein]-cysteine S-methyltransferase [Flavobacterium sp. '19STA2R22 D10 B1']